MKASEKPRQRVGILLRTALLSWLVTTATLLTFVLVILPEQKEALEKGLRTRAHSAAVALSQASAGALITDEIGSVVESTLEILQRDPAIDHTIITRGSDAFCIVVSSTSWTSLTNTLPDLRPAKREKIFAIRVAPVVDRRTAFYSMPFDYNGIEWGWIHVGLSVKDYDETLARMQERTILLAAFCTAISLVASVAYARRLVGPILRLRSIVHAVAGGQLDVRARVEGRDEVGDLASSINQMTEAVQLRDTRLRELNASLSRLATEKALAAGELAVAFRAVTEQSSTALGAARCGVWFLSPDGSTLECADEFDRATGGHARGRRVSTASAPAYFEALRSHRVIPIRDSQTEPLIRSGNSSLPIPRDVTALLDAPIRRGSRVVGVIRHEHTGNLREWSFEEQNFAGSVADALALALEARDRQVAEDALRLHNRFLQGVRFATQRFLAAEDWTAVIDDVLTAIGKAADVCRVYVYENQTDPSGTTLHSRRYEWVAPGIVALLHHPSCLGVAALEIGPSGWEDQMRQGRPLAFGPAEFAAGQSVPFSVLGLRTCLHVPVNANGRWWGFVGIDECRHDRAWSAAETDTLQAAADSLGSAIERQQSRHALVTSKDAAEAASRAKSQFLANMSHEIRTPITGVMGMLQLMQRTPLAPRQERYLRHALTSAETLLTVLGDVLDFSKIEAGKLELEDSAFDLADTLDAAVRLLAERAEKKGLELVVHLAPEAPDTVIGDSTRLRQVLLNLLNNAIKFTDRGEIVVSCTCPQATASSATLRFEVRDTGCGIPVEYQTSVFESFSQADNSMARAHGGTGLGLAISRQLCALMGGQIGVQSQPGQGSTFWFTVRLGLPHAPATAPGGEAPALRRDLRGLRVLVVDDCEATREILTANFLAWKSRPETAPDAHTAWRMLLAAVEQGDPFHTAVLDWRMPGEDGLALARRIHAHPPLAGLGLVLLSSYEFAGEAAELAAIGFAASIPKPARMSDLYNAVVLATNPDGRLPQAPQPVPSAPLQPVPADGARHQAAPAPVRLLLAEDNEINQEVASELLAHLGYDCQCVRTGLEAIEAVLSGKFDLVLMDCQMPGMDGYEATRRIRSWERAQTAADPTKARRTPIIALTAHAMKGDRDRCMEAGMDDYLTKPLDPEAISRTLRRWLAKAAQAASANAAVQAASPKTEPAAAPPPTGAPETPALDRPALLRRCMGKQDLADRLVQKFVQQVAEDLRQLDDAFARHDRPAIAALAHRLKGSSSNISALGLQQAALRLETSANAPAPADPSLTTPTFTEALATLRREYQRLTAAVTPSAPP